LRKHHLIHTTHYKVHFRFSRNIKDIKHTLWSENYGNVRLTASCFSLNLKQDLTVGVVLVAYAQLLHVLLAHIIYMLEAIRGIMRKYRKPEALGSTQKVLFANTDETHTLKQLTDCSFSCSLSYRSIKSLRKNEDLWKASDIWSDQIKKLDEDVQHCKKQNRLFLKKAS